MTAYDRAPRTSFHVGLNYPWKGYGWDFGPTPYGQGLVRKDADTIARSLDELRDSGVTVLRWFVASDGRNLPSPGRDVRSIAEVRTYEGLGSFLARTVPDSIFERALAPKDEFLEDLASLAAMVSSRGMRLLPTFISSTFLTPTEPKHVREDFVARGRTAFVFGNEALPVRKLTGGYRCGIDDDAEDIGGTRPYVQAFLEHTLAPMVEAIPKESVFAWDVMNEPEWCIRDTPYTLAHPGALLHPWMVLTFLNAALRVVARRGHDVSIGFVDGHVDAWYPRTTKRAGSPGIALGSVVGSNISNALLILGLTALIAPIAVDRRAFLRDGPMLALVTAGAVWVMLQGELTRPFGLVAIGVLAGYILLVWLLERKRPDAEGERDEVVYLEKRLELARTRGYAGALGWAGPGDPDNGQSAYADGEEAVKKALSQLTRFGVVR